MRPRRLLVLVRFAAAGASAGAFCPPAAAQLAATLDAAGGSARIDRSEGGSIAVFAPALTWHRSRLSVDASGVYSGAGERGWNAAGFAAAAARSPRLGAFEAEVAGRYRWSAHAMAAGTSVASAELGLRISPASWTSLSLAAGLGSARARGRTRPQSVVRLSGQALLRGLRVELGLDRTSFGDRGPGSALGSDTLESRGDSLAPRRSVVEYTDASLGVSWSGGRHELSAGIGRRLGKSALQFTSWSLSATRWLTPQLALIAGGGHYAADPLASLPSGRYATIGLRIGVGGGGAVAATREASSSGARGSIRASRGIDGLVGLLVEAAGARSVEVMGDFTDWRNMALERADRGRWRARLPITPGVHHLVVRIDDGRWQVPVGAQTLVDEFGVPVGALLVE